MSEKNELLREGEIAFSRPQYRALLRDARLSWAARGLFAFLWDLPKHWRPTASHLAKMGIVGIDGIRTLLTELRNVNALRFEEIRHDAESAREAAAASGKKIRAGQVCGTRWILRSPDLWAIEAPLAPAKSPEPAPAGGSTENGNSPVSVRPSIDEPNAKGLQGLRVSKKEAAANNDTPAAAAASVHKDQKIRRERPSGIVTFFESDLAEAGRVEAECSQEEIDRAIQHIGKTRRKEPVPGTVARLIKDHRQAAAAQAARETTEAKYQALLAAAPAAAAPAAAPGRKKVIPAAAAAAMHRAIKNSGVGSQAAPFRNGN